MKVVWIFSNAVAVVTTLVCMSYLYYACRPLPRGKLPILSVLIIGVTAVITALQFFYPELLAALQRDPDAIRELWRLEFTFIASAELAASIVMLLSADGHGVGLVVGAVVASILPVVSVAFRSKETNTFAEAPA